MSMSNSYPKSNRKEKYYTLLRGRLRKKKRTNVVRDIHILYINYKMHTPPQEPTPQLHRAWGQNLTGIPNVERQTLKRGNARSRIGTSDSDMQILSLNVCGVKNKLNYDKFVNLINKHDIVRLTESKTDDIDKTQIHGFATSMKNRKKLTKTRSSGIMLVVKDDIVKYIKIKLKNRDGKYVFGIS